MPISNDLPPVAPVLLSVRLHPELSDKLTAHAASLNMTKAKLIRKLIKDDINNNSMREDEAFVSLDIDNLTLIINALKSHMLQTPSLNNADNMALYFYLSQELSELSHSLTGRPYTF